MGKWLGIFLGFAGTILAWQYGVHAVGVPEYILPPPSVILPKFWLTLPLQMYHLGVTAATTLIGLSAALLVGLSLALLVVYVRPLQSVILPLFAAFNGIPKIAIAPLFVMWFGLGAEPKVLLAFLMGLFPIFVGAATGLGEIEPDVLDLATLAGGTKLRVFRKVRLMNAMPYLADALKVAFPLALVGSVVGEFIGGNRGIGYLILSGQFNFDTPLVFACLLSISAFTLIVIGVVELLERRFLAWRPSLRR